MDQPGYTQPKSQRGLGLQCLIASLLGVVSVASFSLWRKRWPQLYSARTMRTPNLPDIDRHRYGWIAGLLRVSDRDVLRFAGLDAYVFLMFFRAAISLLWKLLLVSVLFIAPMQWWYSGHFYDGPDDGGEPDDTKSPNVVGAYPWVYVAATYAFTVICLRTMRQYTADVVGVRQAYLGHQNTITDRTLRISGIPRSLRSKQALQKYLTTLFGVEPHSIVLCRKWEKLDRLYSERKSLVVYLERLWAQYLGPTNPLISPERAPSAQRSELPIYRDEEDSGFDDESDNGVNAIASAWRSESGGLDARVARATRDRVRPTGRVNMLGLTGSKVDLIDYYTVKLASLDDKITKERQVAEERPVTSMAFITMKSVFDCQMAAQALFSPTPHAMVTSLAPAPNDVLWRNVYMRPQQRSMRSYLITFVVLLSSAFLVVPLKYLARFLDLQTIKKWIPRLGEWLSKRTWTAAFVTDVLPTFVFSSFNLVVPYFYAYLSSHQGFVSKSDVELSTVAKNFFYVFVNLFLIFTIESTFFSFSVDTTELAKEFTRWLLRLSRFYTNLIVLQGLGLTPLRLLQAGSVFQFPFLAVHCRSARDFHDLYKPPRINYGIMLPNPLFIFIVVLTYSILSRRILLFGLIYFVVGYGVYKYQLLYSMVHPQHSTGRIWTLIMRRVYLGIGMFHLGMIGLLVLQQNFTYAGLILPLPLAMLGFWYDFETFLRPLTEFVAIEALRQQEIDAAGLSTYDQYSTVNGSDSDDDGDGNASTAAPNQSTPDVSGNNESLFGRAESLVADPLDLDEPDLSNRLWNSDSHDLTLDESREQKLEYVNRGLVAPLEGPWVGVDGDECIVANQNGFEKRPISFVEWL